MKLYSHISIILSCLLVLACGSGFAKESYSNGFPQTPNFFPIGVWLQSPARAAQYKRIGINTYVGLWGGPTEAQLAQLAKHEMFAIVSQNELALASENRHVIKAWLHQDEPDNAQSTGLGFYGPCIPAAEVVRQTRAMTARDGTRPVLLNFGQGIANEFWKGRGSCTGDQQYYDIASRDAAILSFDIYPVGSKIPQVKGNLEYVARGVTNLRGHATDGQNIWAILETTALDPNRPVSPAEVRAEVWMSLIHGARGLVYFVHEFSPKVREDAVFRHPDVVAELSKTNSLINSLAIVLNSPDVKETIAVASTSPIATMMKKHENRLYVFAVAMKNAASKPQFTIEGLGDVQAHVIGEDRSIVIRQGLFGDDFEGYGVHIYEIPLSNQN